MRTALRTCGRWFGLLATTGGAARRHLGIASLLTGIAAGLLALAFVPAAGSGASTEPPTPTEAPSTIVRELPELRTETSDTYLRADGARVAQISRTPINYQDSSGSWQPIDTTLQQGEDGALEDSATDLPVSLPSSLSSPVTVGSEGQTVSFSLEGAGGSATASRSSATYAEALPSVSASYEEQATRLQETLSLAGIAAPAVYHYHLTTTGGLSAKLLDGTVVFSDTQGHPRYAMPAPTLADAGASGRPDSSDAHYALSEDGTQLSLIVSSAWLDSPERAFPVTIDPTVESFGDDVDCFIASEPAYENSSLCGWDFYLGYHPEGSAHSIGRGLLRFELGSAIPEDATILAGNLKLTNDYTASATQTIEVDQLKHTPTDSATWNTYDGAHAWEHKGGDYEAASPEIKHAIAPSESGHQITWGVTPLVEKWFHEPGSNHGVILKAENEASGESAWYTDASEHHPYLEVVYSPRIGTAATESFTSQQLGDRQNLSVNVANGNLLVQNHVLELPGIGYDLSINEFYNNLEDSWRTVGMGSILSTGEDIRMEQEEDGSWSYADPSGAWWHFAREPKEEKEGKRAFRTPPGINAKLTEESSGSLVLEYLTARLKYYFNNEKHPSVLEKIVDADGNTTTLHYVTEGLSSIEDTHGHTISFTHNKSGDYISSIKDALGRKWEFTQNSKGQVEAVKDPDGHKSKYTYNEALDLTQIEDPDGHLIELSYGSHNALTEIRHVVNGTVGTPGTKDVITTFNYERPAKSTLECPAPETIGDTEVVSPDGSPEGKADSSSAGHTTYYCYNKEDQVTKTIDQAGNTSTASYDPGSGNLTKYQNPGDTAEGTSGPTNTIAYNKSGAPEEITTGVTSSTSLKATLKYPSEASVEPSSMQTPYSAPKQEEKGLHKSYYGYDSNGDLASVEQDSEIPEKGAAEVKLEHNPHGQVTESIDGNGHKTAYEYPEGNLTKITPELPLKPTTLTYDADGRVHTVTDGREITSTYTYDGEDRVTKVEYSDGSSVSFKYDADGNVIERVDAKAFGEPYTGVTYYEYDKLNRPILETTPTGKSTRYGYDYDGNLTSLEDAGGTLTYGYGPDDLLTSLTEPENSSHPFKFTYDNGDDNRESTTFPNGLLQCTKTDAAGRLRSLFVFKPSGEQNCKSTITPSSTLEDYELGYSFTSKKVTVETPELQTLANLKEESETAYTYDSLNRVISAITKPMPKGSATLTSKYEYDAAGNTLLNHTYSPSTTYTDEYMKYNAANEICAIASKKPSKCPEPEPSEGVAGEPTYDGDGDMTSDGSEAPAKFAYTARDQLSSVTPHGESEKKIVSHGTAQDDLAAIGFEEVIENVLGVGVTGSGESAKYYTRGSEGTLFAKRTAKHKPSETEYYVRDSRESPAMLTNSSGAQTAPSSGTYQYDSYGKSIGAGPVTFGYRSAQVIPDGLIHFGARYYDSATTGWTQQDPLDQASSLTQADRYTFAGDDPVNLSDPSGELPSKAACVAMVFLAFCEMNGGTELQEQVERVTQAQDAAGQVAAGEESDLTLDDLVEAFLAEFS
jgi:RHS repeat-associated protein